MHFAIPVAAALLASAHGASAAYNLVREYSGSSFFDGWEFYGNYDNLTNGAHLVACDLRSQHELMVTVCKVT